MRFIFDVDGTLSFNGTRIDQTIVEAIKKLEDGSNLITFASARPIRDLLPIIPDFSEDHLLIGGNGSIIKTPENVIQVIESIDDQTFLDLKDIIQRYNLNYIVDDIWNYAAGISDDNLIMRQLDPNHLANQVLLDEIVSPIKVILVNITNEYFDTIYDGLTKINNISVIKHTDESSIDITSVGINKFTTLRKFTDDAYYAFGNDSNDLELLKNANKSVWVGKNNERLKKLKLVPDYICTADNLNVSNAIKTIAEL